MKNKLLVFLLVFAMIFTMSGFPVLAASGQISTNGKLEDSFTKVDSTGLEMYFEMWIEPSGNRVIKYFEDGVLTTTYTLTKNSTEILAKRADNSTYTLTSNRPVLQTAEVRTPENRTSGSQSATVRSISPVYDYYGTVYYNYSYYYEETPRIDVYFMPVSNASTVEHLIEYGDAYADAVVQIANIISQIIDLYELVAPPSPTTVASLILDAFLEAYGEDIINGIITQIINVYCQYISVQYYGALEQVHENGSTHDCYLDWVGEVDYAVYDTELITPQYQDGITEFNWFTSDSAYSFWLYCGLGARYYLGMSHTVSA